MEKVKTVQIKVSQIVAENTTQARVTLDDMVVAEYAELMKSGTNFPPVDVVHDAKERKFYLTDGFHRLAAAQAIGVATIGATVTTGTIEDARWRAYGANKSHGLRRTNADKRKAARAALMARPDLTDAVLAAHVGVSAGTILNYRAELESAGVIKESRIRTGMDGRKINMDLVDDRKRRIAAAAQKRQASEKAKYMHCPTCRGSGMVKVLK